MASRTAANRPSIVAARPAAHAATERHAAQPRTARAGCAPEASVRRPRVTTACTTEARLDSTAAGPVQSVRSGKDAPRATTARAAVVLPERAWPPRALTA